MNKDLLISILEIPTYFGIEKCIKEFLISYFEKKEYKYHLDEKGNLYVHKGNTQNYPCVCAHLDSVHVEMIPFIQTGQLKRIVESDNKLFSFHSQKISQLVGMGADDLVGVYLCLEMLDRFENIKAAFFVEEEFGCKGAYACDKEFLKDVGYFIEFDSPTNNWYTETLQGLPIYSNEFHNTIKDLLERNNITHFSNDPYTDIIVVRDFFKVSSCNLPTGYFNWHKKNEYVDLQYIDNHILLGRDFIHRLGEKKYPFETNVRNDYKRFLEKELKRVNEGKKLLKN